MSNKIKLYFLGNSASTPTRSRNLTSMLINYDGVNYLFDTPENVQQQILKSKQSLLKIQNIFLTHVHGDHLYGLFGLLSSMHLNNREKELNIFVPFGYSDLITKAVDLLVFNLNFKINIKSVRSDFKFIYKDVIIKSVKLKHNITTYGYTFKIKNKIGRFNKKKALSLGIPEGPLFSKLQKGNTIKINNKVIKPKQVIDYKYKKQGVKIAYLLDTIVLKKIPEKLKDVNYLIHEATFLNKHKEKSKKVMHSTLENVCDFANKLDLKKLFITHISSRYKNFKKHKQILSKRYKNTKIVKNIDSYKIHPYLKK